MLCEEVIFQQKSEWQEGMTMWNPEEKHLIPWPWLTLTQSLIHVNTFWDSSPDVCHQSSDSWNCLSLLTRGPHFTHLQCSLSFSDKPKFCQPWHFSVAMYFSDSPIESMWSLASFNSDIAFGSHTDVCHCSFYFGGSGMHKAWKTALCQSSA